MITITIKIECDTKIFECVAIDVPIDKIDQRIEDIKQNLKEKLSEELEKKK